ncbi:MAG: hypothetical protein EXS03_09575 [Phycisphaerales bacterium]|nr:hypothetical protein [Phycisphaerales bacterium]
MIAACLVVALALGVPDDPTPRGVTGSIILTHRGAPLMAHPDQPIVSPLLVRVIDTTPTAAPDAAHTYRIDYIGVVAGDYDIRTLIRHRDGTTADELVAIPVTIISELPARHGTDLFGTPTAPTIVRTHYRLIAALFALAWLAVPTFVLVRRAIRNRPPPPLPPPTPEPTLADQLRPLAEGAMRGSLSLDDQARLELLLIAFWSERRELSSVSPAQAISQLRADADASPLLLAIEQWLHSRDGSPESLAELLEPYRAHAPIELAGGAR